jgi:ADP-dependent NAD(P)H-hydrate dehydratase / NAD(P)H-hydrate epimerase
MVVASSVTAVMVASVADVVELVAHVTRAAVVIGPAAGVTPVTRANVDALARSGAPLVLDADALTVFAGQADALRAVVQAQTVLTPHAGEFERVFPGVLGAARDKVEAVRSAAAQVGAVVLLKGADTVIAAPDGRAVVNVHATPFLATAGAGDVLAGVVGGLMAQGVGAFDAACAAVWMHGEAGLRAGAGMTAEDLDAALKETLRALYSSR